MRGGEAQREWERRATAAVVEGVDTLVMRQGRGTRRVAKKTSAPDLSRGAVKGERTRVTKTLSEAEKALKEIEERMKEREEWGEQARRRFQDRRSRSLSRTRTKSIAKASSSASAAASGDESDAKSGRGRKRKPSPAADLAAHAVPPIATTVGASTTRDEGGERKLDLERNLTFKSSMDYLAAKAFSQGHQPTISISGTSGTHSRHQSGDHSRELGHKRSESWGKTALKKAKNACIDPETMSQGVDQILPPGVGQPRSKSSHEKSVLDIGPHTLDTYENDGSDETGGSAAVGIAIGTPPLDTLMITQAVHIEHPYGTPVASPAIPALVSCSPFIINFLLTLSRL
jgi:hypothetical protein